MTGVKPDKWRQALSPPGKRSPAPRTRKTSRNDPESDLMEAHRHLSVARAGLRSINTEVKLLRREFFALASGAASLSLPSAGEVVTPDALRITSPKATPVSQVSSEHTCVSTSTQTMGPALYSDVSIGSTSEGHGLGGTDTEAQAPPHYANQHPQVSAARREPLGSDALTAASPASLALCSPRGHPSPRRSVNSPRRSEAGRRGWLETLGRGSEASPRWALFSPEAPSVIASLQQTPRLSCHIRKESNSLGQRPASASNTPASASIITSMSARSIGPMSFFNALTGGEEPSNVVSGGAYEGVITSRSTLSMFWQSERNNPEQLASRFEAVLTELEEERQLNSTLETALQTRESEVQARRNALEALREELGRYEWEQTSLAERVTILHQRIALKEGVAVKMKENVVIMVQELAETSALLDTILHAHLDALQSMQAAQQEAARVQGDLCDLKVRERGLADALERKEAALTARSAADQAVRERSEGMWTDDALLLHECRTELALALDRVQALEVAKKEAARRREQEIEHSSALVSSYTRLYAHWLMWKINSWRINPETRL